MKRLIRYSILFTLAWLVYFCCLFLVNTWLNKQNPPVFPMARTVVIGDSHLMAAINPALLDSTINICQTAESYIVSFHKLKKLHAFNPGLKHLILTFSYHNLSAFNDYKFTDAFWSKKQFERIYNLVPVKELYEAGFDAKKYANVYMHNTMLFTNTDQLPYIGGYKKNVHSLLIKKGNPDDIIERHFYYKGELVDKSLNSIAYLDSIIDYTKKNHISLTLVCSPLNKEYLKRIPANHIENYTYVKEDCIKQNIPVLDYSHLPLSDSMFIDFNHLNEKGAHYFTSVILKNQLANYPLP